MSSSVMPLPNHNTTPLVAPQPRRAALKLPLPPSPWGPPNDDLGVLVSDAIRAQPHPRRTQPEFKCNNLSRDPPPPPPTPAENTPMSCRPKTPSGALVFGKAMIIGRSPRMKLGSLVSEAEGYKEVSISGHHGVANQQQKMCKMDKATY
ncbi:MAG: hypothetical protein Q9159_005929 [Coniocarpon cinnabarinum]